MRVLVDGRAEGRVDPLDRGLHYGDGLFETLAVTGDRPRFFDWHLERLNEGARRLYRRAGFAEKRTRRSLLAGWILHQRAWIFMRKDL